MNLYLIVVFVDFVFLHCWNSCKKIIQWLRVFVRSNFKQLIISFISIYLITHKRDLVALILNSWLQVALYIMIIFS